MSRPYFNPDAVISGGYQQYEGAPSNLTGPRKEEKKNVRLVAHSDLNGWGDAFQIQVRNGLCYVAASGVNGNNGMTILDVSNPSRPKIVNQWRDNPSARTHKVLLIEDDVLITNSNLRPGAQYELSATSNRGRRRFGSTVARPPNTSVLIQVDQANPSMFSLRGNRHSDRRQPRRPVVASPPPPRRLPGSVRVRTPAMLGTPIPVPTVPVGQPFYAP